MFLPCSIAWGQTKVGILVTSFERIVVFSAPDPTAGHCQPRPPWEAPGHSRVCLTQSLVGSLLLSPGSWYAQSFICVLQESVSPGLWSVIKSHQPSKSRPSKTGGSQSLCWILRLGNLLWALGLLQKCENSFGIIVLQFVGCLLCGFMVGLTSCASQVCCSQSLCPRGRPLLTHTSPGDTQTLNGRSGSVYCGVSGSWCTQGFV